MKKIFILTTLLLSLSTSFLYATAETEYNIYLSPVGSDYGSGTQAEPYKTLSRAKLTVQWLRDRGVNDKINIILKSGNYFIDKAVVFNKDYGNINIIGEDGTVITGGVNFSDSSATGVTSAEMRARFPQDKLNNIKCIDLSPYFEQMEASPQVNDPSDAQADYVVSYDNSMLTSARWPNAPEDPIANPMDGYFKPSEVIETGSTTGRSYFKFAYTDDRISTWANPEEIFVEGYCKDLWKYQKIGVASIDSEAKTVTSRTTKLYTPVEEPGNPSNYHPGANMWFSNVAEELDAPGEYYIDRENKKLYYYPAYNGGTVKVSISNDAFMRFIGSDDITVSNITFENTRSDALEIRYAENIDINSCEINNIGDKALEISYSKNCGIQNSTLYELGQGGVLLGHVNRYALEPSSNYVKNCEITKFSKIKPTLSLAVQDFGVNDIIRNNTIHDAFHIAVGLSGNNATVSYNEIYDVVKGATDAGAIYMYHTSYARRNVIEYNYIHDIGYEDNMPGPESYGIYFDGYTSGQIARNNLFHNMRNGIFINCGGTFEIDNNIFSDVHNCVFRSGYNANLASGDFWSKYKNLRKDKAVWEAAYPELVTLCDNIRYLYEDIYFRGNIANNDSTFKEAPPIGGMGVLYRNDDGERWPQITDYYAAENDIFVNSESGNFMFKSPINGISGFDVSQTGVQQ